MAGIPPDSLILNQFQFKSYIPAEFRLSGGKSWKNRSIPAISMVRTSIVSLILKLFAHLSLNF
jgi:hypothetical protein